MTQITPEILRRVADGVGLKPEIKDESKFGGGMYVSISEINEEFDPSANADQDRMLQGWLLELGVCIVRHGCGLPNYIETDLLPDGGAEFDCHPNEFLTLAVNAVLEER